MPRTIAHKKNTARHDPLHHVIGKDEDMERYGRISQPGKRKKRRREDENGEEVLDARTSKKILELSKDQQEELEEDEWVEEEETEDEEPMNGINPSIRKSAQEVSFEDDDDEGDNGSEPEDEYEELEIDPEDLDALDKLLPKESAEHRTLADIILEKLEAAEAKANGQAKGVKYKADGTADPAAGLDPKIVAVYTKVGELLQRGRYKSGPVPKVFKILPSHDQWARYLALTSPEKWSPQATLVATKIFVSNLKPEQARTFLEGVVLPNVREDIRDNGGKLNVHLYDALKKGLYKPAAFFKGILFPLCKGGCTLKEASIVGSVLARVHVPVLHSAAALLRLANMEYTGPNSLFIRVLLDKKYALPYQVVDGLWSHFIRLANTHKGSKDTSDKLPVLWHQSLLVFTQRYSSDMTPDQKNALLDVLRIQPHAQISPEIRRELVNSVARGEPRPLEDVDMA